MNTILVVDDNKDNIISASAVIRNNMDDVAVLTAESGSECLRVVEENNVDIILLDVHMPGMDGLETCARLKESPGIGNIPVILITAANTSPEERARGLNSGAEAFISKPIDPVELAAQLKAMMRIKKAEDRLQDKMLLLNELVEEKTIHLKRANQNLETQILERENVEKELRELSSRLVDLREDERKHLAIELHDRIGQILTAQGMNLSVALDGLEAGEIETVRERLAAAAASLDSLADEIRSITTDLHPPLLEESGLFPALKWYTKQFAETTGVAVKLSQNKKNVRCLPSKTSLTFFRIAQEAMNNAVKHASPKNITIELSLDDDGAFRMIIHDDGKGFDPFKSFEFTKTQTLGMIGMKERAYSINAEFDVESSTNGGTTITVTVELNG